MPRIATTVDEDLERLLSAEAHRRRITRARLLREAAIHYLGAGDRGHELEELRSAVAEQQRRIERLERRLGPAAHRPADERRDAG